MSADLTMVERVARAICIADGEDPDAVGEPASRYGYPTLGHAFPRWTCYRACAWAAIAAMREPTAHMAEQGTWTLSGPDAMQGIFNDAINCYHAMLDAALEAGSQIGGPP